MTLTSEHVVVGGLRTHYLSAGEGRPVVLIHGLGALAGWWEDTAVALAHARSGPAADPWRVIVPDLPAHGATDVPAEAMTPAYGAQFIVGLLDTLGIERADLVGASLGGNIALRVALDSPARVEHLVLVDAAGLGAEVMLSLRLATIPVLGKLLTWLGSSSERAVCWQYQGFFYDSSVFTADHVRAVYEHQKLLGRRAALLRILRTGVDWRGLRRAARYDDASTRSPLPPSSCGVPRICSSRSNRPGGPPPASALDGWRSSSAAATSPLSSTRPASRRSWGSSWGVLRPREMGAKPSATPRRR